jgi:tRNA 2-selenouridine synthase
MIRQIEPPNFKPRSPGTQIIDVRSPGEFTQGHIPGACNIPLFDDAERANVGTLYAKAGSDVAILKGLEIALPKMSSFVEKLKTVTRETHILLYCWRGGMRSACMAELFDKAGFDTDILSGGYKTWRHFIREELTKPLRIFVLGGYTGSGKTELLHAIALKGEQMIDLEHLACHKGSVFGAFGQPPQATNEQFENDLFVEWQKLDIMKPLWLEDESRMIGNITLPDPVAEKINNGMLISMEVDKSERITRLVKQYATFDKGLLADAISHLHERLGGTRMKDALNALENNRFDIVVDIVLTYYDKAYQFSVQRRKNQVGHSIRLTQGEIMNKASEIIEFAHKCL